MDNKTSDCISRLKKIRFHVSAMGLSKAKRIELYMYIVNNSNLNYNQRIDIQDIIMRGDI
jgi:hypothetical protein